MNLDFNLTSAFSAVMYRRWKLALASAGCTFLLICAVVLAIPKWFQSTATLLIENSELTADLTNASSSREYTEQRLERTKERVLSDNTIAELIRRHGIDTLLPQVVGSGDISNFRTNTTVTARVTGVVDPRTMREAELAYAFDVSFKATDPKTAWAVTDDLSNLFVTNNISRAKDEIVQNVRILEGEANRLAEKLRAQEARIADFREAHAGWTPDDRGEVVYRERDLGREIVRIEDELFSVTSKIQSLQEQIKTTPRYRSILDENGQVVMASEDRLAQAQEQLMSALSKYNESHPDVKALRREIASLSPGASQNPNLKLINPTYAQLEIELSSLTAQQRDLSSRRKEALFDLNEVKSVLSAMPEIDRQYTELNRDYDVLKRQYENLLQRKVLGEMNLTAVNTDNLERYIVISPAVQTHAPVEPDVGALLVFGFLVAIFIGLGAAYLVEGFDGTVRDFNELTTLTSVPILARIPVIKQA